jgi:hypothetical protein
VPVHVASRTCADAQDDEEPSQAQDQEAASFKAEAEMDVLEKSGSQRAIENLLKVYYEPLELWFLRTSVEKVRRV